MFAGLCKHPITDTGRCMRPAGWPCVHDMAVIHSTNHASLAVQTDTCAQVASQQMTETLF